MTSLVLMWREPLRLARRGCRRHGAAGFSLFEVVVAVAVIAALVSFVAPIAARQVERDLEGDTRQQLVEIYHGLLGDPVSGTFGFVGDIGDLPAALADLIAKPVALPVYTTSTIGNVGAGWRGPYVDRGLFPGDEFKDAWGQPLEYGGLTGTGGGRTGRGQTRSAGADGVMGTSDDLVFPLAAVVTDGTLLATVYVIEAGKEPPTQQFVPNPTDSEVVVYRTVDGVQAVQATETTPTLGEPNDPRRGFGFTVHHGPHTLRVRHFKDPDFPQQAETVEKHLVVMVRAQRQVLTEPHLTHADTAVKSK